MIKIISLCLSMLVIFPLKSNASDLLKENPQLKKAENPFPSLYYTEAIKALNLQKKEMEEDFETPKIYLKVKSIHASETLRTIKLNIVTPSPEFLPLEQERKKRKLKKMSIPKVRVGKMVVLENPFLLEHKGPFHLDFIYIFDNFQGKGIGSLALTELKKLAEQLKTYSSFYSTITLVSQDVDYKGLPLPIVPRRVKFYMDNGFQLHPKTINLVKFLDIKHFIDQFDEYQFAFYLCDYILPSSLIEEAEALASYILPVIQKSSSFSSEPFVELVGRVQTDSSLCAKHILIEHIMQGMELQMRNRKRL